MARDVSVRSRTSRVAVAYDRAMHEAWRPAAALALAALAVGGGAVGAAHAGTASGRPAQFTAASGERNDLAIDPGPGGTVQISDAGAPVNARLLGCVPIPPGQARCDPDGAAYPTDASSMSVDLGDGDDRAIIRWMPGTSVRPGEVDVAGGAGDDRIENAATGFIRLDGGDGNDTLLAGPNGAGFLLGGAGADLMESGADCCFITGYSDHDRAGVRVTLDQTPNDGVAGEGDDVRTSGVVGSPGPDAITGDARANRLTGSGGADVLDGGEGDDTIEATLPYGHESDGPDGPDTVTCGAGKDEVDADANDTFGVDCEWIRVGPSVIPPLVLDMGAARVARNGSVNLTYRVEFPNPDNAAAAHSTFRLVDRKGRAASSTARFVLGGQVNVASLRVKLNRATRRRLARSRAGALALIAQRVSRDPDPGSAGYQQFNAPVSIRRAARR
jgi:hypothetical protein